MSDIETINIGELDNSISFSENNKKILVILDSEKYGKILAKLFVKVKYDFNECIA